MKTTQEKLTAVAGTSFKGWGNVSLKDSAIEGNVNVKIIKWELTSTSTKVKGSKIHARIELSQKGELVGTFSIDGLGTKNKGFGCWPSYLPHKIEGDNVIINKNDIISGKRRFM